jgi:hypothetical protein
MASSRSRPSGGAATASDDGRRLTHELGDVHLPVLVSSRHAAARVKTINHLNGSSITPKYIRSTAPDLGQHSLRPPRRGGSARGQGLHLPRRSRCDRWASDSCGLARCSKWAALGQSVRTVRMKDHPSARPETAFAAIGRLNDCGAAPRWSLCLASCFMALSQPEVERHLRVTAACRARCHSSLRSHQRAPGRRPFAQSRV